MTVVKPCSGTIADFHHSPQGKFNACAEAFCLCRISGGFRFGGTCGVEKGGPVLPVLLPSLMGVGIGAGNHWALSQGAVESELIGRVLGFKNVIARAAGAAAPLVTGLLLGPEQNFHTAILVAGFCPIISNCCFC